MKTIRTIYRIIFILLLTVSLLPVLEGQILKTDIAGVTGFNEKLIINTDRQFYITGEQVHLKIYKINQDSGKPSGVSRVIYAELLDASDNPSVQIKIGAKGSSGSGFFNLPDTLASGNYVIRAYTRWMLNSSVDLFAYKVISVINPYKSFTNLVRPKNSRPGNETDLQTGSNLNSRAGAVNISADGQEYQCRSKIRLEVSLPSYAVDEQAPDISLSVIKAGLAQKRDLRLLADTAQHERASSASTGRTFHLPEIEGEIISGTIKDKLTNEPLIDNNIVFSIVGKYSRCWFGKTNERGEFMFPFRELNGMNDIVIQPFLKYEPGYYVELNQPFAGTYADLTPEKLYLDSTMAADMNNAIISMQVHNQYASERHASGKNKIPVVMRNFYDTPTRSINLSDYIELTNVREIIKEILPEISVTGRDKSTRLKVDYNNPFGRFEDAPLVLVDGVPVTDISAILNIPGREIQRIDIFTTRYFVASYYFDGIISFVTRKGNLSDLGYDDTVFRQIYEGCQVPEESISPDYSIDSLKQSRLPDFRNTLYWDPQLKFSGSKAVIEFYSSDEPGDYTVIAEGLDSEGKSLCGKSSFIVRQKRDR